MKVLKPLLFLYVFLFFNFSFAEQVTVTLQNGLNAYNGCEDAWVFGAYYNSSGQRDKNYGNETKMSVFWMSDGSELTREST